MCHIMGGVGGVGVASPPWPPLCVLGGGRAMAGRGGGGAAGVKFGLPGV